jgi:hypothetical protein
LERASTLPSAAHNHGTRQCENLPESNVPRTRGEVSANDSHTVLFDDEEMMDDKIKRVADTYAVIVHLIANTPDDVRPTLLMLVKRLISGLEYHDIVEAVASE